MSIPKFVKVIVDDAHDTTRGRIYKVDLAMTADNFEPGSVWIEEDDIGDPYYLYASEYKEVTND